MMNTVHNRSNKAAPGKNVHYDSNRSTQQHIHHIVRTKNTLCIIYFSNLWKNIGTLKSQGSGMY